MTSTEAGPKTTIQSVARASRILLAVAASPDGMTARAVADQMGLTLTTAYNLLNTLGEVGLLTKNPQRRFVVGPMAAIVADAVGREERPPAAYTAALDQLAAATGETAYLSGWRNGRIAIVRTVQGAHAVRVVALDEGFAEHPHARAAGKLLLALSGPGVVDEFLSSATLTARTAHTITTPGRLRLEFAHIRSEGVAFDAEEFADEVCGVAAPIWEHDVAVAALTLSAPAGRFAAHRERLVATVRDLADRASYHTGRRNIAR